jgi:hypothetical protein
MNHKYPAHLLSLSLKIINNYCLSVLDGELSVIGVAAAPFTVCFMPFAAASASPHRSQRMLLKFFCGFAFYINVFYIELH